MLSLSVQTPEALPGISSRLLQKAFLVIHTGFSQVTHAYSSRNIWSFYHGSPQKDSGRFFYLLSYCISLFLIHPSIHPSSSHPSFIVLLWTPVQPGRLALACATSVPGSYEDLQKIQLLKSHCYGCESNFTFSIGLWLL